jgi:hypothetical protein
MEQINQNYDAKREPIAKPFDDQRKELEAQIDAAESQERQERQDGR